MNKEIESIFKNFEVDGTKIPVSFLRYKGTSTTYITYQMTYERPAFSTDDKLIASEVHYDFNIYSKGNYLSIVKKLKQKLKENGWLWVEDSQDFYEDDTEYYHKTIEFIKERTI